MRIAFDITQTGKDKAGCGYFAYSLLRALAEIDAENEYLLMNSFGEFIWDGLASPTSCGIQRGNFRPGLLSHSQADAARSFWHRVPSDLDAALGNPDIVHSNNFFCPTGLRKARLIYTLYDLSFIEHPEWTTEANRTVCFDGVFHASLYANAILAISEYSRDHFLRVFPHYPADQVHVIYPASRYNRSMHVKRSRKIPGQVAEGKFWLCVGTLEPRKNHLGLLQAYAQHKAKFGRAMPLVHAGGPGWLMNDFKDEIRKLKLQKDVILLGYVDDTDLQWLYQNCFAFVYPSFFEGFGMPVLEALSSGAAVITSNTTSIPEIVGDAGLLVDPHADEQLTAAMNELAVNQNRLAALRASAVQRAARFSWIQAAQQTLDLYRTELAKSETKHEVVSVSDNPIQY
jgi:glycosyltransferase involved in cell wall biosynthesis